MASTRSVRASLRGRTNATKNVPVGNSRRRQVSLPVAKVAKAVAPSPSVFGPVTTIDSAPVSIGNTISGAKPNIIPMKDGVRVQGRDYMFQVAAVAANRTDWLLTGGCPLIPHAFVASTLRAYASMYAEFVVHGITVHYITSTSTASTGDILFYFNKNRGNALLDTSNNNFLSVVLSDPHTIMGPLWKNHSAGYRPSAITYSTDILNDEDLQHEGPGEVFLYTKSAGLLSPGYVLVDYDITFKTFQTNIRALQFPIARLKYAQVGLGYAAPVSIVQGGEALWGTNLPLLDGITSSGVGADPQAKLGDVYKVVLTTRYMTIVNAAFDTLLQYELRQASEATEGPVFTTIDDGFTLFAVHMNTGSGGLLMLYPTLPAAMSQQYPYAWGVTSATVTMQLHGWISLVGNVGGQLYQSKF